MEKPEKCYIKAQKVVVHKCEFTNAYCLFGLWLFYSPCYFAFLAFSQVRILHIIELGRYTKFIYSEKATKIEKKISPSLLTLLSNIKENWEIFSNFVSFLDYIARLVYGYFVNLVTLPFW